MNDTEPVQKQDVYRLEYLLKAILVELKRIREISEMEATRW